MSYLKIIEELEKKTNRPTQIRKSPEPLSKKEEAIKAVLDCFPGTTIVSDEEVQKVNAKGYFDPSEWAESQTRKPGEEG